MTHDPVLPQFLVQLLEFYESRLHGQVQLTSLQHEATVVKRVVRYWHIQCSDGKHASFCFFNQFIYIFYLFCIETVQQSERKYLNLLIIIVCFFLIKTDEPHGRKDGTFVSKFVNDIFNLFFSENS